MAYRQGFNEMKDFWFLPGSPKIDGSGWKVWYSLNGNDDFAPQTPHVFQRGKPVDVLLEGECLPVIENLNRRIYIGTLSLPTADPGSEYEVYIPETDQSLRLVAQHKTIPDEGLSFILASCYWNNDDKEGYYARAVATVMKNEKPRPAFKMLIGDQVYLDYPIPIFTSTEKCIPERYLEYWGNSAYRDALGHCPTFYTCDDHEFWNNFPEFQSQLPFTYTKNSRKHFEEVALKCLDQFQSRLTPDGQTWYTFEISPASFFVADTRSKRSYYDDPDKCFIDDEQWLALDEWQQNLKGPGILVLGQPLYQQDGSWKDYSLSNFEEDYGRLMKLIEDSFNGNNVEGKSHKILILSGDIHNGRHAVAYMANGNEVHEFIASPASRIGPFISEPETDTLPTKISGYYEDTNYKWSNISVVTDDSLELYNNIAVIRLFDAGNGSVRVEFRTYRVRPFRRPTWKIFAREGKIDFSDYGSLCSYDSSNFRKIILN